MFIKRFGRFKLLLLAGDLLAFLTGVLFSFWLLPIIFPSYRITQGLILKILLFALAIFLTIISFRFNNLYKHKIIFDIEKHIILLFKHLIWTFIIILIFYFLFKPGKTIVGDRALIISFLSTSYFLIFIFRFNFRLYYLKFKESSFLKRKIIAIGAGELGTLFIKEINSPKFSMFEFKGFLDDDFQVNKVNHACGKFLGTSTEIVKITKEYKIDEIFITINNIDHDKLLSLIKKCRATKCNINVLSSHFGIIEKKIDQGEFKNLDYVTIHTPIISNYFGFIKRLFDILLSILLILILSPFLIIISIIIGLTSRGPILYTPYSIGKDGTPFRFLKFRSMHHNSPTDSHKKLVEEFINGKIVGAKLRHDPRVTKIGKFLRKYSLDELPQLFNVLKGEMSIVGPRPSTEYEFNMMEDWHKKRFEVLPGMTGLWQVAGRSEVSYIDMIMMDIYYVENGSFWLDLYILFKTFFVVIKAKGGH